MTARSRAADGSRPDLLVISNAEAGSNDEDAVAAAVNAWRTAGCDVEVTSTGSREELAGVVAMTDRLVVAAGGDGSIHAIVQAMADTDRLGDVVVGLLPLGTGNDLARGVGLPRDAERAAQALLSGTPRPMGLLVDQDGTVGVNAVNLGIGAAASERASDLKDGMGAAAYPVGAVVAGATEDGWRLTVTVDDVAVVDDEPVLHVVISNGPSLGGGTAAAPGTSPDDDVVEVVVSTATGPLARVGYASDLRSGGHTDRDDVLVVHGRTIEVDGDEHPWNVDGELPDPRSRSSWRLLPAAWRLRHPGNDPDVS